MFYHLHINQFLTVATPTLAGGIPAAATYTCAALANYICISPPVAAPVIGKLELLSLSVTSTLI